MLTKKHLLFLVINLLVISILYLIFAPTYDLFHLINAFFYIGYFYLSFAILLFVMSKRFFDGITYGFRRFYHKYMRNSDLLDEWEEKPLPSEWFSSTFMKMIFFQGIVLTIIMLLLLVIYYL